MTSQDGTTHESAPGTSRRGLRTVLLTAVAVALAGAVTAGAVFAATADGRAPLGETPPLQPLATPSLPLVQPERLPEGTVPSERVLADLDAEKRVVPEKGLVEGLTPEERGRAVIDSATVDWLESLQTAVRDDPDFGSVAISEDHATVTITWFGEPSAALREQLDMAPAKVRAVVQPAAFRPAELQELVRQAMRDGLVPGIDVTVAGPRNDGSGLQLSILELPAGRSLQDVGHDIATALGRPDVPITVDVSGPVVPITGTG
ncbi:hypothetical protein [Promicromonospora panici]|uniref:hypothetical protein n=1 Tax=Promicromonospora panici TaxID=2219658 RepID=UPI00101C61BF|nr:hypothetical protein [Promicromonospora panici]